jgi:hypothetical protein
MIKAFIQKYEDQLKKIAREFIEAVRAQIILMNPLILDKPMPIQPKFDSLLANASQQIQNVSFELTNNLFSTLESKIFTFFNHRLSS